MHSFENHFTKKKLQTCEFECFLVTGYDSTLTCGYRDVLVNMCFENDITSREFFERLSNLCMCRVTIYAL